MVARRGPHCYEPIWIVRDCAQLHNTLADLQRVIGKDWLVPRGTRWGCVWLCTAKVIM
jgi:hypothetical protein